MRSPRVYFRAVLVPSNQSVLIIGGTANGLIPLASVEVYNLSSGCFRLYDMSLARMKHTATYLSVPDKVLVIGGQGLSQVALSQFEELTIFGSENPGSKPPSRFSHETGVFNLSSVLIVSGQGMSNSSDVLQTFAYPTGYYNSLSNALWELFYLEGHSVTSTNSGGKVLVLGGNNGRRYPGIGFIYDGVSRSMFNGSIDDAFGGSMRNVFRRAHHRTIYIPSINAFLVTGGDNGVHVFSSCFLLYPIDLSVVRVDSLTVERTFHSMVLLNNGSVLVMGGAVEVDKGIPMTPTASVEIFDPNTKQFTSTGRLTVPSYGHEVVSDGDGEIFLFGGIGCDNNILSRIEYLIY